MTAGGARRGRSLRSKAALLAAALALAGCPPAGVQTKPPVELKSHPEPQLVGVEHTVAPGETLWRISQAYGVSVDEIVLANGLSDPTKITVGQRLFIPGAAKTAPKSAVATQEPKPEPPRVKPIPQGNARLRWPLIGVLYAKFGKRGESIHEGIDISAPEGSIIAAAADGTVLFAGFQRGYGNLVILDHGDGLLTIYAHNKDNLVQDGAKVRAGDPIARVGPGTRTSGPHLHFEVREGRIPKDPLEYLPEPR
ncbi:MAG: peptidoglycan DD-metalloendopeptidase family protein [Myxococcales bacterium]|jgi:lipoprotein NlpD